VYVIAVSPTVSPPLASELLIAIIVMAVLVGISVAVLIALVCHRRFRRNSVKSEIVSILPLVNWPTPKHYYRLEACIDDERQFKTAKRPQAPGYVSHSRCYAHVGN